MPLACVLQHIRCEPPGLFSGPLRDRGYVVETVELDEGGRLPDWREAGLVLAMGGPMGAYDEAAHPWLAAEKRWIAAAVGAGTPYLGVCLGSQLLAASLGAEVRPGDTPEVGVLPVEVTAAGRADPVFGVLGGSFPALQWHGDTFAIPAGAVHLARSSALFHAWLDRAQQHELTITRQRLATVDKRCGAAFVRLRHLPNAAARTYSHTIVSSK